MKIEGLTIRKPEPLPKHNLYLVDGVAGSGKGHAYGTPILTPDRGWVAVEKLQVGDDVVGVNGLPTTVYGVYDRGELPVYRVGFKDGGSVLVDADHLWRVLDHKGKSSVFSTRDIMDRWGGEGEFQPNMLSIPVAEAVVYPVRPYRIPPYMLGALLADGSLHGGSIQWTKNDPATVECMRKFAAIGGFDMREVTRSTSSARQWAFSHSDNAHHLSVLNRALDDLGLRVKSHDKFIPPVYLMGSIEQRRELLAGLFDGDGRLAKGRQPVYHSTSYQLAHGVYHLLWSLGVPAALSDQMRSDGTYRVRQLVPFNPFGVHPKGGGDTWDAPSWRRGISSIESAGTAQVRCLAVTAPDKLYVTKDYIVTHNTTLTGTVGKGNKVLILDLEGGTTSFSSPAYATLKDATETDNIDIISIPFEGPGSINNPAKLLLAIQSVFDHLTRTNNEDGYTLVSLDSIPELQQRFLNLHSSPDPRKAYGDWTGGLYDLVHKMRQAPVDKVIISRPSTKVDEITGDEVIRSAVNPAAWRLVSGLIDANGLYSVTTTISGKVTRTLDFSHGQRYQAKTRLGIQSLENPSFVDILNAARQVTPTIPAASKFIRK